MRIGLLTDLRRQGPPVEVDPRVIPVPLVDVGVSVMQSLGPMAGDPRNSPQ